MYFTIRRNFTKRIRNGVSLIYKKELIVCDLSLWCVKFEIVKILNLSYFKDTYSNKIRNFKNGGF